MLDVDDLNARMADGRRPDGIVRDTADTGDTGVPSDSGSDSDVQETGTPETGGDDTAVETAETGGHETGDTVPCEGIVVADYIAMNAGQTKNVSLRGCATGITVDNGYGWLVVTVPDEVDGEADMRLKANVGSDAEAYFWLRTDQGDHYVYVSVSG
jgi:hypothetical protein